MGLPGRILPGVSVALLALSLLVAGVQADTPERSLQLDERLEQKLERAVVYVSVEYTKPNSTRRYIESGSGFFVAPGQVITNSHVVAEGLAAGNAELKLRVFSGTPQARFYPFEVTHNDPQYDLALLKVVGDVPAIEPVLIEPQLPGKQSQVFAFGFPLGTMLDRSKNGPNVCLRRGYVSRMINDGTNIEADLNLDKGISGGPLVDAEGMVRGVVRAMAGSDFNKTYAGISVAAPVLLRFCQMAGCPVTLSNGQVLEPGKAVAWPDPLNMPEADPRPRAGFAEDLLRAYFAIGASLRLSTLVPSILVTQNLSYTPDLRQNSRGNVELVVANLKRVEAPEELRKRAGELATILTQATAEPKLVSEKSTVLEQACDEWVQELEAEEKLNYDLGAWLTELSLGLLDVKEGKDLRSCTYFLKQATDREATTEIMALLKRLETSLQTLQRKDTEPQRRAVTKDADKLIGIGYLATQDAGRNTIPKNLPAAPSPAADHNQIHVTP